MRPMADTRAVQRENADVVCCQVQQTGHLSLFLRHSSPHDWGNHRRWAMIARVDVPLLFSITGWIGIGITIGGLTYAVLVRLRPARPRADLPLALILGLVGALIGGAVGWSIYGGLTAVLASFIGATLGALLLCVAFQFLVPV